MSVSSNIFIVGPMGVGKSTVGRALARLLKMKFFDADAELEKKTGASIPLIFEVEGEEGFRKRETGIIDALTTQSNVVLATGGGAVLAVENRRMLRSRGTVVYLSANAETLFERTRSSKNRPLLSGKDRRETMQTILKEREPIYLSEADVVVHTDNRTAVNVAREIVSMLEKR